MTLIFNDTFHLFLSLRTHRKKSSFSCLFMSFLLRSLWNRRRFFPLQRYTIYEIYGCRIKMKCGPGYWLPHWSQMSCKCATSNVMTSLSDCFTLFWYFASRVAKETYFTILSWRLLACVRRHTFSNIYSSEQLEALWDCFFFHYTVSIFQIHFIVLPSIQNLLIASRLWLVATSSKRHLWVSKKRGNNQRRSCDVKSVNPVICTSLPLTDVQEKREKICQLWPVAVPLE